MDKFKKLINEYSYLGEVSIGNDKYMRGDILIIKTKSNLYSFWHSKYILILGHISINISLSDLDRYIVKVSQSSIPTFKSSHIICTRQSFQLKGYKESIRGTLNQL